MDKYWEAETPVTIITGRNVLKYYPEASKLTVGRPTWIDTDGYKRMGKTVTLDVSAIIDSGAESIAAAREMFTAILEQLSEQ